MKNHSCVKIVDRPTDWLMGDGNITLNTNMPSGDWTPYYHFNERQKFVFDNDLCVIFSEQEDIDVFVDWLISTGQVAQSVIDKLTQMEFMDFQNSIDGKPHFHSSPLFTGSLTGNGMNGNSLPDPWDVVRKYGFQPWLDRPFTAQTTPQDVLRKPSDQELKKAIQIMQYFSFNYHWLVNGKRATPQILAEGRKMSPIQIGIAISDTGYNQIVPAVPMSTAPQHSILDLARNTNPSGERCADHYEPFLKTLTDDYPIMYALQGIVTAIPQLPTPLPAQPTNQQISSWLSSVSKWVTNIINLLKANKLQSDQKVDPSEITTNMNYSIFRSKTFYALVFIFVFNGFAAISASLPADVVVGVNAVLGLVASIFHLQTGNSTSGAN